MKTRVEVAVDPKLIESSLLDELKKTKRQVAILKGHVAKRDKTIGTLRSSMGVSKERRSRIRSLCESLIDETAEANWAEQWE